MANNEFWFAFVLIPVYLGIAYSLSLTPLGRRMSRAVAFVTNYAIAAAFLGTYAALTGLADGNWIGVSLFSGAIAAAIATALSAKFAPRTTGR